MKTEEELCWERFKGALREAEIAAFTCVRATEFTQEKKDAKRQKLLAALWETAAAIRFGVLPADRYSPVSEGELKTVAEELLATITH
jgi:hypothetical protein